METLMAKRMRLKSLSDLQLDLVIGSLLGDGYLVRTTRGYAFRVNHGLLQTSYLEWKYKILRPFVRTKPKKSKRCYYFRTITHPTFTVLHSKFYKGQKRIVAYDILQERLNPFMVAVWVMDDGSKDGRQLRINSQAFSDKDNRILQELLRAKLGIETGLNRDKGKFRLRVKSNSMNRLIELIKPIIIPSMLYKLPL